MIAVAAVAAVILAVSLAALLGLDRARRTVYDAASPCNCAQHRAVRRV